jgi:hypothetical protein
MRRSPSHKDEVASVLQERGKRYLDATFGHTNLSKAWTGILQTHYQIELPHDIPADVTLLMMVALKVNRAAHPTPFLDDNYLDGKGYMELARVAKRGNTK